MDMVNTIVGLLEYLWHFPIIRWIAALYVGYQCVKITFLVVLWRDIKEEKEACARRDAKLK